MYIAACVQAGSIHPPCLRIALMFSLYLDHIIRLVVAEHAHARPVPALA